MRRGLTCVVLCFFLVEAWPVLACIWDRDTLAQERSRFPSALELITGRFPRHSEEFYRWRIQDRLKKLEDLPQEPSLYDDLAVAYEKTGDHQSAIEWILRKERLRPGLYETYANLGTFYIHAGRYAEGLPYIEKAIRINSNAHFGREVYQRHLVEYLMRKVKNGKLALPIESDDEAPRDARPVGFARFLMEKTASPTDAEGAAFRYLPAEEAERAVKGILGMMRFGNYRSPVLLEALGDLLGRGLDLSDAKQLAARAYLKASYEVADPNAKKAYREKAWRALQMQTSDGILSTSQLSLEEVEQRFRKELREADAWYQPVRADELRWIAEGKNPEIEFEKKYLREPAASSDLRLLP